MRSDLKRKYLLCPFLTLVLLLINYSGISLTFSLRSSQSISSYGIIEYTPNKKIEFGFCVHEAALTAVNWTKQAEMLRASGSKWVRSDIVDRGDGLGPSILKIDGYQNYGQKLLGIIDYWTINPSIRETFTLDDWKNVVTVVATKFKGIVNAYEIWNEPELTEYQFGYMDGTPEHYVNMLKEAYNIIKSIDPSAIVVGGVHGASDAAISFAKRIFELGAADYMDVHSVHLYRYDNWSFNYGDFIRWAKELSGKPIWVTETGEVTGKAPAWIQPAPDRTEEMQAEYMRRRFNEMINSEVKPDVILWYLFYDWEDVEEKWGVVTSDYTPKLAYYEFKKFALGQP